MKNYILNEHGEPVLEPNFYKWAKWHETADRTVKKTKVGDCEVSTVFLAIDHGFNSLVPVLWETLVFGGPLDGEMDRYTSRADAERGHEAMVQRCQQASGCPRFSQ